MTDPHFAEALAHLRALHSAAVAAGDTRALEILAWAVQTTEGGQADVVSRGSHTAAARSRLCAARGGAK